MRASLRIPVDSLNAWGATGVWMPSHASVLSTAPLAPASGASSGIAGGGGGFANGSTPSSTTAGGAAPSTSQTSSQNQVPTSSAPSQPSIAQASGAGSVPDTFGSPLSLKRETRLFINSAVVFQNVQTDPSSNSIQAHPVDTGSPTALSSRHSFFKKISNSLSSRLVNSRNSSMDRGNSLSALKDSQMSFLTNSPSVGTDVEEKTSSRGGRQTGQSNQDISIATLAASGAESVVLLDLQNTWKNRLPDSSGEEVDSSSKLSLPASNLRPEYDLQLARILACLKGKAYITTISLGCSKTETPAGIILGCINGELLFYALPLVGPPLSTNAGSNFGCYNPTMVFNKEGVLSTSRVIYISWMPHVFYRFSAVFADGTIAVFDIRLKSTAPMSISRKSSSPYVISIQVDSEPGDTVAANGVAQTASVANGSTHISSGTSAAMGSSGIPTPAAMQDTTLTPSQHDVKIWKNSKVKKSNPVSVMILGCGGVNAADMSVAGPFSGYMSLACRDGYLRIIDVVNSIVEVAFRSYYGSFLCTKWSCNGQLICAGGQDDALSIFSALHKTQIARCEGHTSWVSAVAFRDPPIDSQSANGPLNMGKRPLGSENSDSNDQKIEISSAGQDCRMLFWEFDLKPILAYSIEAKLRNSGSKIVTTSNPQSGSQPKGASLLQTNVRPVNILGRGGNRPSDDTAKPGGTLSTSPTSSESAGIDCSTMYTYIHPEHGLCQFCVVPSARLEDLTILEPVASHYAHNSPLTDILYRPEGIISADCDGLIRCWSFAPNPPKLNLS
eukprot:CAMPEP_0184708184 /NCGR_PEP_ID=MMETSP0313-20130426/37644_1 /TAXON_ID=2792 /ORGANISM="Porphyridium aerugineum, Strain SAG 1380-2" /LENGTH=783 /DNA_ID=CAMNT_0027169767 /DNA_START=409 /DNA_END=2761 /DNA_ORIENTATION=+